jgi:MFS family permease
MPTSRATERSVTDSSDLQWINNAYTLVFAATLIIAGGVAARIGLRRAMVAGMLIFAGGSAAAALSGTPETLIGFRAVMGLGAGAGLLSLAAFVGWELRTREPMIDVPDFARRGFAVAAGSLGITFFALFGALFIFTQYLQLVHGFSPLKAGLGALPFALTMASASATSAAISARIGARHTVAAGLGTVALGLVALSLATVGTPYPVLATIMAVIGGGMGMIMAPASTVTISAVPQERSAGASSINSVVRELGGVLGIAVIGTVVAASYRDSMRTSAIPGADADITAAHQVASQLPGDAAVRLVADANEAFTAAMNTGTLVAAAVATAGALAALVWLPRRAAVVPTPSPEPEATRELVAI